MHQISQIHAATHWPLDTIASQNWVRQHSGKTGDTRYPVKLFRYWFTYHLIHEEYRRRNRPLRICEIGVDRGQMLVFAHTAGGIGIERWDAIDYRLKPGLE